MTKTLIIGGCGYVGSRLYRYLEKTDETTSVDLELFGNPGIENNLKINYKDLDQIFLNQFNNIILLAGHSSVKMCEDNMIGCYRNNVMYFLDLITKIRADQKFVYASSSSVYGNLNRNIISEDCEEYIPGNFYDLSKSEIDNYISIFNKLDYYGLRFGTVNGISENFRTDIMINAMSMSAIKNQKINIYNPMIKRPILWIEDLCRAIDTILKSSIKSPGIYNLASFNSTVDIIGRKVNQIFKDSQLEIHEDKAIPEQENINKKLHSKVYNFAISSEKFKKIFSFDFIGNTENIAENIKDNLHNIKIYDTRNKKDIIV